MLISGRHLKPGGFLEQVEIDWQFLDGETGAPISNQNISDWNNDWIEAMNRWERPITVDRARTVERLREAGFDNIQEQVLPIPCNPWPEEKQARDLGRWFHLGLTQGVDALTTAPLCHVLRKREDDAKIINEGVKREFSTRHTHAYCRL
jgi:hypothetical protein